MQRYKKYLEKRNILTSFYIVVSFLRKKNAAIETKPMTAIEDSI